MTDAPERIWACASKNSKSGVITLLGNAAFPVAGWHEYIRADAAEAKLAEVQLVAGVALHTQKQLEADLTAALARAGAAEAKLKAILEADAQIWAADMVRQIPKEPTE